ncbi:MAG: DPP IV N-terminal domain-containing protein [Bacillota bacterium]|jgi:dipeptidyl-peptidase-4
MAQINEEKQIPEVTWEDYARAEKFLPQNIRKLAFELDIVPNWAGKGDCFWYKLDTRQGKKFMFVNPEQGVHREAFDHVKLASQLSFATKRAYVHTQLPFDRFRYTDLSLTTIAFEVEGVMWQFNLENCEISQCPEDTGKSFDEITEVVSPDEKWAAFVKDHNLYIRCISTGESIQVTFDGEEKFHYAVPFKNPLIDAGLMNVTDAGPYLRPVVVWSPDSKRIFTYKVKHENVGECYLVQSCPLDGSKRPRLYRYVYPLPGDQNVPMAEPEIIDLKEVIDSQARALQARESNSTNDSTGAVAPTQIKVRIDPVQLLYYGGPRCWTHWSTDDGHGERIYLMRHERGYTVKRMYLIDADTGDCRVLMEEEDPAAVDYYTPRAVDNGRLIIWHSAQDGWAHLYLYDGLTGKLINRITSGPWVVRGIDYVDELNRTIYFSASGLEEGRNPYYRHLYKVSFDGSGLQLLTPEDAEHEITFTPSGRYFIDHYSRVDLAPVTVLRQSDGTLVSNLGKADLGLLFETGWTYPERFCVKARDGVTDIYGMIIRPSNFDPSKTYPVIEANYSGPQTARTPRSFGDSEGSRQFWQDQAIAELGFIVVTVDGLGMAFRSKAFQDYSYRNLGDAGMPDHIAAFRQLATRYPYMDLSRVGIYGGSAGGYGAARAILAHPDFYKVAVVWAGNHDHRTDKASWIERYMGLTVGPHYEEQANPTLASNLKGKMFVMHGEMDENVPPAASLQLVDALIKANKDFDFLILPNGIHADGYHPYITRKRWDYFVEHLLGATPPQGYRIEG